MQRSDRLSQGWKDFARTFSYRELLTSLMCALVIFALLAIRGLYGNEDWVERFSMLIGLLIFTGGVILNHVFYKVEHGRSNRFLGRLFQGLSTMTFLICLRLMVDGLYTYSFERFGSPFLFIVAIVLLTLISEATATLLKKFLGIFKLRPW